MKDISIFAKPASYYQRGKLSYPHLFRGSSIIRGEQISNYLGCKLNPVDGYNDDICIYVKPTDMNEIKDGSWVDIMDGERLINLLVPRPEINVITFSDYTHKLYQEKMKNKMVLIPQHHCNFNRELRSRRTNKTVGFIGGEIGFFFPKDKMQELVEEAGFRFLFVSGYRTREDVLDFYRQVDIQITWSHPRFRYQARAPLKLTNASSFGIPTVGYPQECYGEAEGNYIKVDTIPALIKELRRLHDPFYYDSWVRKIVPWSEKYHISKIAELYRQL